MGLEFTLLGLRARALLSLRLGFFLRLGARTIAFLLLGLRTRAFLLLGLRTRAFLLLGLGARDHRLGLEALNFCPSNLRRSVFRQWKSGLWKRLYNDDWSILLFWWYDILRWCDNNNALMPR